MFRRVKHNFINYNVLSNVLKFIPYIHSLIATNNYIKSVLHTCSYVNCKLYYKRVEYNNM